MNMSISTSSMTTNESDSEDHIKVCVRIRPVVRSERDQGEILSWNWDGNQLTQLEKQPTKNLPNYQTGASARATYYFDHLFYPEHTNRDIFDSVVKSVVNQCMNGYHGSVFTYGQTSSGKTFTMTGNQQQPGIIPQTINFCFDSINTFSDREFLVRVSFMEIYNEQVKDLLNSDVVPIKIQHDPKNGTVISGVKEQVVVNAEQTISFLKAGEAHRHVGATDMNEKSSRAHTLFKLTIESRERTGSANNYAPVRVSTLNLVDLAGSENAKMTNSKGDRALEARYINQSLLTLSTIIHKLSEEKPGGTPLSRRQHLPYRDSKLTRILQPSLDGNAQIAVICTISPVLSCVDETNNTLKFASRAKSVKVNAKVNDVMDEKTLLKVYREEIEQLKAKLFELEMQSKLYTQSHVLLNKNPEDDDEKDDEKDTLLQMITEMESMILKAEPKRLSGYSGSDSGTETPTAPAPDAKFKRMNSARPGKSDGHGAGIAMLNVNEEQKTLKPSPNVSSKDSIAVKAGTRTSITTTTKTPPKPPVTEKKPTNIGKDKENVKEKDKDKNRFGFGFGFNKTKGNLVPDGSGSFETKEALEKLKKKEQMENTHMAHDATISGAESESDYNSVDGDYLEGRPSTLDRQSSVGRVQSFRGDDVGDKVLFGVSKMLAALKIHIGKSRGQGSNDRKSTTDSGVSIPLMADVSIQAKIDRLELDLRLKEADNRFLQEELDKKDKMLAMLTEGLREVESSQQEWLTTNQELSDDLEKALVNNAWLAQELVRLQGLLLEAGVDPHLVQSQSPRSPRKQSLEEY